MPFLIQAEVICSKTSRVSEIEVFLKRSEIYSWKRERGKMEEKNKWWERRRTRRKRKKSVPGCRGCEEGDPGLQSEEWRPWEGWRAMGMEHQQTGKGKEEGALCSLIVSGPSSALPAHNCTLRKEVTVIGLCLRAFPAPITPCSLLPPREVLPP